jgi:hypothetical protein
VLSERDRRLLLEATSRPLTLSERDRELLKQIVDARRPPEPDPEEGPPSTFTGQLNGAQLAVLRWIAAGCPPDRMHGYAHRISASALRSRGLLRIDGRGATLGGLSSPTPDASPTPGRLRPATGRRR